MIEENIRRKIEDLINRSVPITSGARGGIARDTEHLSACQAWLTEALNIIELAIPMPKNAYRRRIEKVAEGGGGLFNVSPQWLKSCVRYYPTLMLGCLGNSVIRLERRLSTTS
jgi:hypothetical protein